MHLQSCGVLYEPPYNIDKLKKCCSAAVLLLFTIMYFSMSIFFFANAQKSFCYLYLYVCVCAYVLHLLKILLKRSCLATLYYITLKDVFENSVFDLLAVNIPSFSKSLSTEFVITRRSMGQYGDMVDEICIR